MADLAPRGAEGLHKLLKGATTPVVVRLADVAGMGNAQAVGAPWLDCTGDRPAVSLAHQLNAFGRDRPDRFWLWEAGYDDFDAVLHPAAWSESPSDLLDVAFAPLGLPGDARRAALRNAIDELALALDATATEAMALIAAGWLTRLAHEGPCALTVDVTHPFSGALVKALLHTGAPILIATDDPTPTDDEGARPAGQLLDPLPRTTEHVFESFQALTDDATAAERIAVCRAFLDVGQLQLALDAIAPLGLPLPGRAAATIDDLREYESRPRLLARTHAMLRNRLSIDALRSTLPFGEATGRLLLRRLDLLEAFDRIGVVDDARATAVEAAEIFRHLPGCRAELRLARRWEAWATALAGDAVEGLMLFDRLLEALDIDENERHAVRAWRARALAQSGLVEMALDEYASLLALPHNEAAPLVHLWHADAHTRAFQPEAALASVERFLAQQPASDAPPEPVLQAWHVRGAALANLGHHDEAIALLRNVVAERELVDSTDAPQALRAKHALGATLLRASRPAAALSLLEEVVDARLIALETDHELVVSAQADLATCYVLLERWTDALAQLATVIPVRLARGQRDDLRTITALQQRVQCLLAVGRRAEALGEYQLVRSIVAESLPASHPLAESVASLEPSVAEALP